MNVYQAMTKIMTEVGPVAKTERNAQQGFMFRGVDQIVNAVEPIVAKHGVLFLPNVTKIMREPYQSKGGTMMINTIVEVEWHVYGPEGDQLPCPIAVPGEAADSADKSLAKAVSVSWREALIKAFMIVVGDEDPDSQSPERSSAQPGNSYSGTRESRGSRSSRRPRPTPAPPEQVKAKRRMWDASKIIDPALDDDQRKDYIYGELKRLKLNANSTEDLIKGAVYLEKIAAGQTDEEAAMEDAYE